MKGEGRRTNEGLPIESHLPAPRRTKMCAPTLHDPLSLPRADRSGLLDPGSGPLDVPGSLPQGRRETKTEEAEVLCIDEGSRREVTREPRVEERSLHGGGR